MEPEQLPTPNNDVDSILRDAAAPLHYKSTVRALLGMPDAEGENPTFARMVPPARFQYYLHPPTSEASRIPTLSRTPILPRSTRRRRVNCRVLKAYLEELRRTIGRSKP
jgi:hypothetical protein